MKILTLVFAVVALVGLSACSKKKEAAHDHGHGSHHGHQHVPPHGGTPVILGNEDFHLELVRDPAAGSLTAYVLDAHMAGFIRLPVPAIELAVQVGGRAEKLTLAALPNQLSGETVGDTSAFVAQAEWLKTTGEFSAVVPSLTIRGRTFTNVAFDFPKGNEAPRDDHAGHDHKH
jgi:hypothetical protein